MIHLFSGENTFEIDRRVKELVVGFDGEVEKNDGSELAVENLPDLLSGMTLFSSNRLVVMKSTSQNKPVWSALGEWLEKGVTSDLILVEKNPDKRTKTYKWIEKNGQVMTMNELKPFEVERWLSEQAAEQKIKLGREEVAFLVDYIGVDQWLLLAALTKLSLSERAVTKDLIRELIEPTPQATSFELLDAAFAGNRRLLSERLEIVRLGEDPYMFFGLLSSQIYALALVHSAGDRRTEEIAKDSGVHPFVLKKISSLATGISKSELIDIVRRLAELDEHLKSRPVDPWVQINSFLVSLK